MNLDLSKDECLELLQISKGNTLVLVLFLSRLSRKLETIASIQADFSKLPTTRALNNELAKLPPSGFDIISEFMFKNTFEEVELIFNSEYESYLHSARPIDRKIMESCYKPKRFWQWHDELKRY